MYCQNCGQKLTASRLSSNFSLGRPDNGFPVGEYEVSLFVEEKLSTTLKFSVEK